MRGTVSSGIVSYGFEPSRILQRAIMLIWAFAILLMDILLFVHLLPDGSAGNYTYFLCAGIAVCAIAVIIRTITRIKAGRFEKLDEELKEMRGENKELLGRIGSLREQEIINRTDKDLI